ncbi:MAG: hypothetical protein M0Z87_10595 [Actinomycetota bacterium]|nr:hypothetical protein [Actinomycetota bacterium]
MSTFGKALAGSAYGYSDWTFGVSSAREQVAYVNSSPAATMPQLAP